MTYIFICAVSLAYSQGNDTLVRFSPVGGLYEQQMEVQLYAEEDVSIYYTLDGSIPNSTKIRYRNPIKVDGVAVIRAIAYKNGQKSAIVTHSYFTDRKYTLPVVSITTNPGNLWDSLYGIYVKGCCADTVEPYLGANFWKDWEKLAHIEMYEPDGKLCFNQDVGINLFGGFSRALPQKSLAVFARKKYGNNRIEYPIFPERDHNKYKSFVIRNSGGDFLRTHFRDALMTQMAAPTGLAIQAYRPAVIFLNGKYWGIQNLREKINEHYLKANFNVDKDNVDILRHNGVKRHGYSTNYKKLLAYLRSHDLGLDSNLNYLRTFMDVDDYIRYNIAEVYSDNRDAGGNIRYWRERNDSAKWRWVFYDLDLGLGNNEPNGYKRNTLKKFTSANAEAWPDPAWSTFIIRKLLENRTVQIQYINTFCDHLNTVYHPDTVLTMIDEFKMTLQHEMPYHLKRWGSSYENWEHHIEIVKHFVKERPSYLRKFIAEKFDLSGEIKVTIKYPGSNKGIVQFNSLTINRDFVGTYFKDIPLTIEVKPKHDYVFVGWEGRVESEPLISVQCLTDIELIPIIEAKRKSEYYDSLLFTEICAFQTESDSSEDWIEIYNRSNSSLDISNWIFTDKSYHDGFVIPENTVILPNEYVILSESINAYKTRFNTDTVKVIGDFDFGLSADGELLKLYDSDGFMVDSISFGGVDLDSSASYNLIHPDSLSHQIVSWKLEQPNPGIGSRTYRDFLKHEADKKRWTQLFYIGGGSFFFILVVGILWRRFSKKRRK